MNHYSSSSFCSPFTFLSPLPCPDAVKVSAELGMGEESKARAINVSLALMVAPF